MDRARSPSPRPQSPVPKAIDNLRRSSSLSSLPNMVKIDSFIMPKPPMNGMTTLQKARQTSLRQMSNSQPDLRQMVEDDSSECEMLLKTMSNPDLSKSQLLDDQLFIPQSSGLIATKVPKSAWEKSEKRQAQQVFTQITPIELDQGVQYSARRKIDLSVPTTKETTATKTKSSRRPGSPKPPRPVSPKPPRAVSPKPPRAVSPKPPRAVSPKPPRAVSPKPPTGQKQPDTKNNSNKTNVSKNSNQLTKPQPDRGASLTSVQPASFPSPNQQTDSNQHRTKPKYIDSNSQGNDKITQSSRQMDSKNIHSAIAPDSDCLSGEYSSLEGPNSLPQGMDGMVYNSVKEQKIGHMLAKLSNVLDLGDTLSTLSTLTSGMGSSETQCAQGTIQNMNPDREGQAFNNSNPHHQSSGDRSKVNPNVDFHNSSTHSGGSRASPKPYSVHFAPMVTEISTSASESYEDHVLLKKLNVNITPQASVSLATDSGLLSLQLQEPDSMLSKVAFSTDIESPLTSPHEQADHSVPFRAYREGEVSSSDKENDCGLLQRVSVKSSTVSDDGSQGSTLKASTDTAIKVFHTFSTDSQIN